MSFPRDASVNPTIFPLQVAKVDSPALVSDIDRVRRIASTNDLIGGSFGRALFATRTRNSPDHQIVAGRWRLTDLTWAGSLTRID